jgi:hypothetical protein
MKTVCGKTISYLQTDGHPNKMHSTTGPAVVYSEEQNKAPEYYLYGIKYSKADWKERVSFRKPPTSVETFPDSQF